MVFGIDIVWIVLLRIEDSTLMDGNNIKNKNFIQTDVECYRLQFYVQLVGPVI